MKWKLNPKGRPCSLRLEKVESKIVKQLCSKLSNAKNLRGWGKKGVLFFFGLFYFRNVVQAMKY